MEIQDYREIGMGLGALMPSEVEAWARLNNLDLLGVEADALHQIDRAFREVQHEKDHPKPQPASVTLADAAAIARAEKELKERWRTKKPNNG